MKPAPPAGEPLAFLEFCERNFGKEMDLAKRFPSQAGHLPDLTIFVWHDVPEPGVLTAVSYGLSHLKKPEWTAGRPELMLRLETDDAAWATAMGAFINLFWEEKTFRYQTLLTTDEPLNAETEMKGFFTFAPLLSPGEEKSFKFKDELPIFLTGLYPVYIEERELLPKVGLEAFWKHELFDPYDVRRPNLALLDW